MMKVHTGTSEDYAMRRAQADYVTEEWRPRPAETVAERLEAIREHTMQTLAQKPHDLASRDRLFLLEVIDELKERLRPASRFTRSPNADKFRRVTQRAKT